MRNIFVLLRKDLLIFRNDRVSLGISFVAPALLILIFGWIFGGSGDGGSGANLRILLVDQAQTPVSHQLVEAFRSESSLDVVDTMAATDGERQPLTEEEARKRIQENASQWRHALILPTDLVLPDEFAFHIELVQNRQYQSESQLVEGLVQKTLFSKGFKLLIDARMQDAEAAFGEGTIAAFNDRLAEVIGSTFNEDPEEVHRQIDGGNFFGGWGSSDATDGDAVSDDGDEDFASQMLKVDREEVYGKSKSPAVHSIGGWAVMFLLFSLSGMSAGLLNDKYQGIYLRLLSGPVTRTQVLWSKFLFLAIVGYIQLCALFAFGHLFFRVFESTTQIAPILLLNLPVCLAGAAIGMVIVSICKTESQAGALSTMVILPISAFGGAMFPVFMLPSFIQQYIAPLTMVYWAMDGYYGVLWRDQQFSGIWLPSLLLLVFAAVLLPLAIWRFRRGDLFR